jgi:hypothetical protein
MRRVAECNVAMHRLLQSNELLSTGIEANIMKLKKVDNPEVSSRTLTGTSNLDADVIFTDRK